MAYWAVAGVERMHTVPERFTECVDFLPSNGSRPE